jgi:hypothetical protein
MERSARGLLLNEKSVMVWFEIVAIFDPIVCIIGFRKGPPADDI